jgi:hypothetical protein
MPVSAGNSCLRNLSGRRTSDASHRNGNSLRHSISTLNGEWRMANIERANAAA